MYSNRPKVLPKLNDDYTYPYFFKNENIDDKTYIIQKSSSISNALYVLDIWNKEGYNIGETENGYFDDKFSYTKYLYNANNDIVKVDINGGNENYKVLLYKKDGKIYTSSMLEFVHS
jgi:hypothetical protein